MGVGARRPFDQREAVLPGDCDFPDVVHGQIAIYPSMNSLKRACFRTARFCMTRPNHSLLRVFTDDGFSTIAIGAWRRLLAGVYINDSMKKKTTVAPTTKRAAAR
jgi:hypothetical protein